MEVYLLPRHTYMEPQKDFDAYIYMVKWALPLQFIGSSMIPIIATTVPFYVGTTCNFCTYAPAKQLNSLSFCTKKAFLVSKIVEVCRSLCLRFHGQNFNNL